MDEGIMCLIFFLFSENTSLTLLLQINGHREEYLQPHACWITGELQMKNWVKQCYRPGALERVTVPWQRSAGRFSAAVTANTTVFRHEVYLNQTKASGTVPRQDSRAALQARCLRQLWKSEARAENQLHSSLLAAAKMPSGKTVTALLTPPNPCATNCTLHQSELLQGGKAPSSCFPWTPLLRAFAAGVAPDTQVGGHHPYVMNDSTNAQKGKGCLRVKGCLRTHGADSEGNTQLCGSETKLAGKNNAQWRALSEHYSPGTVHQYHPTASDENEATISLPLLLAKCIRD